MGPVQIGRLAMRVEGEYWNAYYMMPNTVEGAVLLGSIRYALVANEHPRKWFFMELMEDAVADMVFETTGQYPEWGPPQASPEHEKAGNG